MDVTVEIPDHLADLLERHCGNLSRAVLEGFAVEGYRSGRISAAEVGSLLGHQDRWETEELLSAHDAWPAPTTEEVGAQLSALAKRRGR